VNSSEKNTAEYLSDKISPIIQELIEKEIKVVAIIMDNEMLNNSLHTRLANIYPFLVHVPCSAHTLQLVVKRILQIPSLQPFIEEMNALINLFVKVKAHRLSLHESQEIRVRNNGGVIYSIIKPCDTRWSSSYLAAQRLLKLKEHINFVIPKPDTFWSTLTSIVLLLEPFKRTTDILQSDSSTLFDIYKCFKYIYAFLRHPPEEINLDNNLKRKAVNIIRKHWFKYVNFNAVICTCMFSFDDTFKVSFSKERREAAKDWFVQFAINYLLHYKLTDIDDKKVLESLLLLQLSSFNTEFGIFSSLKESISSLKALKNYHVRNVWTIYLESAFELSICAIAILSIASSEASVERSFSAQDIVHNKRRNRLNDNSINDEMTIKFNRKLLVLGAIAEGNHSTKELQLTDDEGDDPVSLFEFENEDDDQYRNIEDEDNESDIELPDEDVQLYTALPTSNSSTISPTSANASLKSTYVIDRSYYEIPIDDYANVNSFIEHYVSSNKIELPHRFDRMHLQSALLAWDREIKDTEDTLIKKIKQFLEKKSALSV
jgi:Protein of unknown function (DUF 659)/hAT family C-terminal dimerisation region